MKNIFAFSAIALTTLVGSSLLSTTEPASTRDYEFCRQDYTSGMRQCGFDTMEQCIAMISGRGGSCVRDPFWPRRAPPTLTLRSITAIRTVNERTNR